MDQDSFRLLLQGSGSGSTPRNNNGTNSRGKTAPTQSKKVDAAQPAFKPRKVKKASAESKYRDRAAERREGGGNDYAHVEAILEDFERRNADSEDKKLVEEQRKYLGGDGEHSILVKGLDMALLEQNKARAALDATEDDDTLEQAYMEASSNVPQKRTRADIINELKRKNAGQVSPERDSEDKTKPQAHDTLLDEAKKQGKFKPIGFKPIGGSEEKEKKKKKKVKSGDSTKQGAGEERKKKKRKVDAAEPPLGIGKELASATSAEVSKPTTSTSVSKDITEPIPELEPSTDDFDIFAGVNDYEGIDLGADDDDAEDETEAKSASHPERRDTSPKPVSAARPRGWFITEDSEDEQLPGPPRPEPRSASPGQRRPDEDLEPSEKKEVEEEEEQPIRLKPLEGSALPSIRDFLAMDEAAQAAEKRRKRKEKKKAGGGGGDGGSGKSLEQKVNRDYQRLQSYTSKKDASGT